MRLQLEDGSDYGYAGTVQFSEVMVDQSTGTVTLRARFPNPQGMLLPGMFVTRQLRPGASTDAPSWFRKPAVPRDPTASAYVYRGRPGQQGGAAQGHRRPRTSGANWVVTAGLKPGEGSSPRALGNLKQDSAIRPVPASSAAAGRRRHRKAAARRQSRPAG